MIGITRFQSGKLLISIGKNDMSSGGLFDDVLYALNDKNMEYHHSYQDGWEYIYDGLHDTVYWVTDYGFSMWTNLRIKGWVELAPHENSKENYEGYEWNAGKKWRKVVKRKPVIRKKKVTRK